MDEPRPLKILRLRAEIGELGGAIRQLRRSGMDSAAAELLVTQKRAELEKLLKPRYPVILFRQTMHLKSDQRAARLQGLRLGEPSQGNNSLAARIVRSFLDQKTLKLSP